MIRVNLIPSKKKKGKRAAPRQPTPINTMILLGMLAGWSALAGLGWWVLEQIEQETSQLQSTANRLKKETKAIEKEIDLEKLQASKATLAQQQAAIEKLTQQRRTPAQVMHEMANILTLGKSPDVDNEKQRQRVNEDPRAKLNPAWDGKNVWIKTWKESAEGTLQISGVARDASDISEYFKRVRASARFGNVAHAKFRRDKGTKSKNGAQASSYDFTLSARIQYWD